MTDKQIDSLKVKGPISGYLKQLLVIVALISGVAKAAYTYYIEPKTDIKISKATKPIKHDVMFIKILLEQKSSPEDIKNATVRMEYLESYREPKK